MSFAAPQFAYIIVVVCVLLFSFSSGLYRGSLVYSHLIVIHHRFLYLSLAFKFLRLTLFSVNFRRFEDKFVIVIFVPSVLTYHVFCCCEILHENVVNSQSLDF